MLSVVVNRYHSIINFYNHLNFKNMKRFVLSVIAFVCVSIGMHAAINVWSTSINGQDGYGIYGWENPGDIAAFLGGTYDGVVFNNGSEDANWATDLLPAIKSADAIKLGGGASGEIIGTADLQALALLTDVVYLRMDNSSPAADADFSQIAIGSTALLDVTLPTGVTKAQVVQANTALKATATGLKLTTGIAGANEITQVPHYWYTLPGSTTPIEYTGEVTEGQTTVTFENEDIQVPLTIVEGYPVSTYVNTYNNNKVTSVGADDIVSDGKVSPANLEVALTPKTLFKYGDTTYDPANEWWLGDDGIVTSQYGGPGLAPGTQLDPVVTYTYSYYNGQYDAPGNIYTGTIYGNETDGYYGIVENTYPDHYKFDVTTQYQYTYVDLNGVTQTTEIFTSPQESITLQYSGTRDLTTTYEPVNNLIVNGVVACVNSEGAMADADFLFTGNQNAAYKSAQHVVVIGEIDDNDVAQIKSFTGLKLLDLSDATATKEQVAACVKEGDYNAKDIALLIPTPQTSDYTTGMSDLYYYQTCCGSGSGLKNVSFYEMVDGENGLTQTRNLKVWGANSTLANLNIDPELIDNEMGISFLPNYYDANGGLNWPVGNFDVYGNVEEGFVANTLSQLDCVSIDMMWLKLNLLKYDFSSLNPETHYIVIPHNRAGYEAASDIDDRVDGTDYVYNENIWVVGVYAGTAHPYSTGIAFSGNHVATDAASAAQNKDYEFNVTTNVTYIRQAGTLVGAAATLNQFQKNATRMIVFGEANADDLAAMQYVASPKVDLSILELVDGAKISDYQNTSVQYLALPDNGAVGEFKPSALKGKCPALLGVGLYKEATDVLNDANEKDNKLYYASWQEGGVRVIMHMLPEAQITSTSNGVHAYKMWGPLNHADISNTDAQFLGLDGHFTSEGNDGKTVGGLLGKSTQIYDADLSMAWFPNQDDMNFNAAAAYDGTQFVACELPRTRMTTIPAHAFENMQGLHYIAIPNIYTTIKEKAFYEVGLQPVGDGSLVGPLQIDTYEVVKDEEGEDVDTYSRTADDALIVETISNGPLTVTLPESLGNKTGEGLYTGSMQFTTRVKDVYVMADPAPYCQIDAFGSVAYVGNNTYGGVQSHPFARDKYRMGVGVYTEETENQWICVLHFPASTVKNGENYNYTDPTREYCLYDETGLVDGNGMPVVWPNQSEMLRSYNQAVTGVTWNAWDRTRIEDRGFNNYNEFATEAGYGEYNTPRPDYNLDDNHGYDKTHYCGWHQFILANTWLPEIVVDEDEEVEYVKLDWYTFCIPYNMTKKQVIELLGIPKSENGKIRKLNGVQVNADVLPDVRTLVAVTRYPFMTNREIKLHLSKNIVEQDKDLHVELRYDETAYDLARPQANSGELSGGNWVPLSGEDNQVYIKGGYPYLIRAYVPKEFEGKVNNLGGLTLMRGTFGPENAGYKHTCTDGYAGVAPYEQKVQAYINEKDKEGVEDPRVYPALYDDTEDETESITDTPANERYIYTFVGQYWPQYLPLYSYYLGTNSKPAADATTQKKFYRATAKLAGSEVYSKWTWNPYVAIITANADKKNVHEPFKNPSTGAYTSSLTMDFNGYDDTFGKGKAFNGTGDENGAKYVFVFDDGIDDDLSGETTSIGYFNGTPVLPANGKIYNMNGQFVGTSAGSLQKGLYVVNGKKFIIK